jgi:hypothetical protein
MGAHARWRPPPSQYQSDIPLKYQDRANLKLATGETATAAIGTEWPTFAVQRFRPLSGALQTSHCLRGGRRLSAPQGQPTHCSRF